jgi:hypothetical protein
VGRTWSRGGDGRLNLGDIQFNVLEGQPSQELSEESGLKLQIWESLAEAESIGLDSSLGEMCSEMERDQGQNLPNIITYMRGSRIELQGRRKDQKKKKKNQNHKNTQMGTKMCLLDVTLKQFVCNVWVEAKTRGVNI